MTLSWVYSVLASCDVLNACYLTEVRNILYVYDSLNKAFQVISKFLGNSRIHAAKRDTLWSVVKSQ